MFKINGQTIRIEKYPNGEARFPVGLNGTNVTWAYDGDHEIVHLAMLADRLRESGHNSVHLTIAYLPYSRMDRAPGGHVFTLRSVARIINSLGFASIEIIDPHSDVALVLIDNSVGEYYAPSLAHGHDYDYVVFPDAGAEKRYGGLHSGTKGTLIGNKHRNFETGRITKMHILRSDGAVMGHGSANGSSAVIIDDLCSYGGTFVLAAKELRYMGIEDITLCVTHLEDSVYTGELFDHVDAVRAYDTLHAESQHPQVKIVRKFR